MIYPERSVREEIDRQRPCVSPELLSRKEKDRCIERGFHGLYRWYVARSQEKRNWNPDRSFDWRDFRKDHSPELITILEGFYAIEQYAPDYTSELLRLLRRSYGRSHFYLRWGAEEEKHADVWRNSLLFSGARTPERIEEYTSDLRNSAWTLPWDDPLHNLVYTVFQERATQLNYLNVAKIARGESDKPELAGDTDPALARVAMTIAADEAAHYNFFLEGTRIFLYYYPEETLNAIVDVLKNFAMPAASLIANYDAFVKAVHSANVFTRRQYGRDVVLPALANLGVTNIKQVEAGIKQSRQVPDEEGQMRDTALFEGVDFDVVETTVRRIFARIETYEDEIGLSDLDPTRFVPNIWTPE